MQNTVEDKSMYFWWKLVLFKNYNNFAGRARRSEFWGFVLTCVMIILPLVYLQFIAAFNRFLIFNIIIQITIAVLLLAILVPFVAVVTRRLHDSDKSGFFLLLAIVPIVFPIVFAFTLFDSDKITNKYGVDPKNEASDDLLFNTLK
jgi:uncharacterized membrane protein YhaH (DUF805 family)